MQCFEGSSRVLRESRLKVGQDFGEEKRMGIFDNQLTIFC